MLMTLCYGEEMNDKVAENTGFVMVDIKGQSKSDYYKKRFL